MRQVYEQGKGLAFHFDKDEYLFKQEQQMHHPLLSSILYLTGPTFPKRLGRRQSQSQRHLSALHCAVGASRYLKTWCTTHQTPCEVDAGIECSHKSVLM